jgi:hypothetical protein
VTGLFTEGDTAEVDVAAGVVRNLTAGGRLSSPPLPGFVLDILRHGGLRRMLRAQGYILDANQPAS